ncbi:MAG: bifunctional riboflavin kinase/FMN adenylyltransferase [Nitrosomonadaceae bacterium]|nr:bifunctional riboflavin kinase/FMN adenylyltransferase [Nitrosomonadaceae bacterium]|tara:strand:+ start:296 stop:1234 length:939 start_codon:yes stop_codon:yes gene_type:complete
MHVFRGIPTLAKDSTALTIGNFDGVHLGHQAMIIRLNEAAARLNLISCVMIFEPNPREFFAPSQAPVRLTSLREKLEIMADLNIEHVHVCHFNSSFASISAEDFIVRIVRQGLSARWILVGDDFRFGANRRGDCGMLKKYSLQNGFKVEEMKSYTLGGLRVSSTAIRKELAIGDLDAARCLLGRPYSISGRVVGGDKLGKKIGFPTANIQLRHNRPPVSGIFVVKVYGTDEVSPQTEVHGVASLGVRPTIYENGKPVLEVHLFNFDREIYGCHLRVVFLQKIRDEKKYLDLGRLTEQIRHDVEKAKRYFLNS